MPKRIVRGEIGRPSDVYINEKKPDCPDGIKPHHPAVGLSERSHSSMTPGEVKALYKQIAAAIKENPSMDFYEAYIIYHAVDESYENQVGVILDRLAKGILESLVLLYPDIDSK